VKLVRALLAANAVAIPLLWALALGGPISVRELAPGYANWYFAFPAADAWLWLLDVAALAATWRSPACARPLCAAVGAVLLYILVYVAAYELRTGLLAESGVGDPVQLALKAWNLACGGLLLREGLRAPVRA